MAFLSMFRGGRYGVHILLFLLTLLGTTLAGAEWSCNVSLFSEARPLRWGHLLEGLHFSVPFLGVLTVHEFGHYVAARWHRISVTLPYYIPLWLGFVGIQSIGTAGAFIRIRSRIRTRAQYFDVGVAGPLAGFVFTLGLLAYGFATLPPAEHIFSLHPEYKRYGMQYAQYVYEEEGRYLVFGHNLLFDFFKSWLADPVRVPHLYEMVHYPYLLAGYLSLFFTALNLLPIGQLDGGHVWYALVGRRHYGWISRLFLLLLLFYAGLGLLSPYVSDISFLWAGPVYVVFLYLCMKRAWLQPRARWGAAIGLFALQLLGGWLFPQVEGYPGWLLFGFLLGHVLGVDHPEAPSKQKLSLLRRCVAYLSIGIFLVCFSGKPFLLM